MSLSLSLAGAKVPVSIVNEAGEVVEFELREMKAAERDAFFDAMKPRMAVDPQGKTVGIKKFDGLQAELVGRCLYRQDKLVPREEIQKWPGSVVTAIYQEARKLNGIDDGGKEAGEKAKNE